MNDQSARLFAGGGWVARLGMLTLLMRLRAMVAALCGCVQQEVEALSAERRCGGVDRCGGGFG